MRLIFTSRKRYWQLTKGKFFSPLSARANANEYFDKTKTPFVPQWTDDWFIDYTSVITPPRLNSFNVDPGATLLHEGRTIRKVIGGGGGLRAKYKKILAQGKIKWKKIHARQLTRKIFMLRPKKHSYKEFDNKKNSCGSKIPHPPKKKGGTKKKHACSFEYLILSYIGNKKFCLSYFNSLPLRTNSWCFGSTCSERCLTVLFIKYL